MLLSSIIAHADIYLDLGESTRIRGVKVHCGQSEPTITYYCTIESAFDGVFSGRGDTELEAKTNAINSCKNNSRGNGIHCRESSIECESSFAF